MAGIDLARDHCAVAAAVVPERRRLRGRKVLAKRLVPRMAVGKRSVPGIVVCPDERLCRRGKKFSMRHRKYCDSNCQPARNAW